MKIRANATRQELSRLRARIRMAQRGHRLLKDKRDQLMREFLSIVHESRRLRQEIEERLGAAYKSFSLARAVLSPSVLEEALMVQGGAEEISVSYRHIMNVLVPEMEIQGRGDDRPEHDTAGDDEKKQGATDRGLGMLPSYGLATTSSDLDEAISKFQGILPLLVRLSHIERTIHLLADEIEKTRRRVNALEHVLIPELEQAVKSVAMRLEEMERANISRLMKIKEIVRAH
ncbi:MAG: V-type ATP synthase subunit D [Bacillota bacterium]|nr:V-type ATP synthase subunit D [Candidatus Fermentithermobacillaceae bacterium]